jgi:hypothetical protein
MPDNNQVFFVNPEHKMPQTMTMNKISGLLLNTTALFSFFWVYNFFGGLLFAKNIIPQMLGVSRLNKRRKTAVLTPLRFVSGAIRRTADNFRPPKSLLTPFFQLISASSI